MITPRQSAARPAGDPALARIAQRGGEARGPRFRCEHADQTPGTNLSKLCGMRDGQYKSREAFLRTKQDIT